ncbi:MAG TPA: hypothetical protein PLF78_08515 [Caulobacter sp.]|nr:hypothetical protein [Caulobacter sp.]
MFTPAQIAFALVLLIATAGAFLRGGPVERRGAGLFAFGMAAFVVAEAVTFNGVRAGTLFAIDLLVLFGLVALAWKSPRPWPVYACGFQTMVLAGHVARWIDLDMDAGFHFWLMLTLNMGALAVLTLGAWLKPKGR